MLFRGELAAAGRRVCALLLLFPALAALASQAPEPKSRIRHAEPIALQAATLPSSSTIQPASASARLTFDAYGRRFSLDLESNERLLRRLPAARRAELPPHDIYRGQLTGMPESWVRLTRLPDGIYGAIWDGAEFYSIAPAHALAAFMGDAPSLNTDQALIYRASDVEALTAPGFCSAIDPPGLTSKSLTGADQYRELLNELRQASTATFAARELDVAMIGDFEFYANEIDPLGELLYRLNIVDGIFSEQVGVAIAASELKVFDNPSDPFTSADPVTLLDQVGSYRAATPAIAATGLAHLVTGRDLVGPTVGVAYIAGVCEAEFGVSLSERFIDPFSSALIAAHEFGHNFGAPHDGEAGSPCATTGFGFLMSPVLNGSSTFSQCSLSTMASVVAASSCIRKRQYVDVAVELPSSEISAHTRIAERLSFEVASIGTLAANDTKVVVELDGSVSISVISADGECTPMAGGLTCSLGQLQAGQHRRFELDLTGSWVGSITGSIRAAATDDAIAANDRRLFTLKLDPATDAAIRAEPQTLTVLNGDELVVSYVVNVSGVQSFSRAVVQTFAGTFQIVSVTPQAGTCNLSGTSATCEFGTIAPGATRRVSLRMRSTTAGRSLSIVHQLTGTTDDTPDNNSAVHDIRVNPLVDLVVRAEPGPEVVQRGTSGTRSFTVLSIGPRSAHDARLRLSWPVTLEMTSVVVADATCTSLGENSSDCVFDAPIEAGGTRRADITFVAARVGSGGSVIANVSSPDNQHIDGPLHTSASSDIDVRESADVGLTAGFDINTYDSHPFRVNWRATSLGLATVDDASLEVTLPQNVIASSASSTVGDCTISASSVRCSFGSLPTNGFADIEMTLQALLPGVYSVLARAAGTNDADPDNNAATTSLDIVPNIDVSLNPLPEVVQSKVGRTFHYTVGISTASHPVDNVSFETIAETATPGQYEILSVTPSQGSCELIGGDASCALGTLPARATAIIDFELQGVTPGNAAIRVRVDGDNVVNLGRKSDSALLVILPIGNAAVAASASRVAPTVGTTFVAPAITVTSLSETESVALHVSVPQGLAIVGGTPDFGTCEVAAATVDCTFGQLVTGERRTLDLRLRAEQVGTYTALVEAVTEDDSDPADNETTFVVEVAPGAAPGPPPATGGGGGSLDWTSLIVAALGLGRRRLQAAISHTRQVHSGRWSHGPPH